jgi:cysteinyl-tRNA synthetase
VSSPSPAVILAVTLLVLALMAVAFMIGRRSNRIDRRETAKDGDGTGQSPRPPAPRSARQKQPAGATEPRAEAPAAAKSDRSANRLAAVRCWGYQLQHVKPAAIAAAPHDLVVIDYSRDGSAAGAFSPAEVALMQRRPDGGRRQVLAYLSIGEAESYRYYWQKGWGRAKPGWLIAENPDWEGNYAVCFWEPAWQRIICGEPGAYLDRLIAAGYDGVYLDKCDVHEDIVRRHPAIARRRSDLESDMTAFLTRLSRHAKTTRPGFLVVMQNAESLLARDAVRSAIDGVAKEELLYGVDGGERRNQPADIRHSTDCLERAGRDGKAVLVVEYLAERSKIEAARSYCRERGFVLAVSAPDRELDRLGPALTG